MNFPPKSLGGRIMLLAGAFIIYAAVNRNSHPQQQLGEHPVAVEPTDANASGAVNMRNYNQLKTGMSYEQVIAILGSEGAEMSSNEIGGIKTVMYQWKGGTMANMNAMFQNNKLMSKAQFGLE